MANVKSDGIAFLMRRFETHVDAGGVFTRLPDKAYRAGSIRGQRDVHQIIDIPALGPINRSNQFLPTSNGSKLVVKSSSKSMESSVLSSPTTSDVSLSKLLSTGEMKVNDKDGTSSQQAAAAAAGEENATRTNSMGEHEPEKSTLSTSSSSSTSDPSKDSISTPQTSESNVPTAIENQGQVQFRSSEDGSAARTAASDLCIVPINSPKISGSTNELDAAERKAAKGSAVATRFIFKQASRENPNATVYLDDASSSSSSSSPSTSTNVKQLARSMDNLCSNSAASTPSKGRNVFHVEKSARAWKWSDNSPSTAPAAIPSLANDEKAAARAKKPPPVPKKNPKVSREAEGRELDSASGDQSRAKPQVGESQTMPNLGQAKKPAARPTTLLPDHQVADNDGGGSEDENNDDDDDDARHKSLPILGSAKDDDRGKQQQQLLLPTNAQKNTLFPCNRQKTRTRILSAEENSTGDQSLPYSPFVTSPMSLGTRTPPGIDSLVDNKTNFSDEKYSSEQQSTTADNAFTRSRSSDQLLSVAASAAATDDVFDSHEAFDPDSFLSDAFDFLGSSSNSAESETIKMSPLKLWTDTWCKASQKRLSKAPDKLSEVAGSSREHRPAEGSRKEPTTGNLPDKTKPQDEKTVKTKSTNVLNVGLNKTSNAHVKSSGRDEKTKTSENAEPPPTHFGVVLRRTDAPSSLFRRSSIASLVSTENLSAPKKANARHESFVNRPVTTGKSTESFRTSDRMSVKLNRKPSMVSAGTSALPLTAAVSSQKPTPHKSLFGRNIVSRASSTLNRTSAVGDSPAAEVVVGARGARQSTSAHKLESELNDIERAFMFLDGN